MKIYFVRHGESQANLDNHQGKTYYCGQLDVDLTQTEEIVHRHLNLILIPKIFSMSMCQI